MFAPFNDSFFTKKKKGKRKREIKERRRKGWFRDNQEVASIENKMRENRLRWFSHVKSGD